MGTHSWFRRVNKHMGTNRHNRRHMLWKKTEKCLCAHVINRQFLQGFKRMLYVRVKDGKKKKDFAHVQELFFTNIFKNGPLMNWQLVQGVRLPSTFDPPADLGYPEHRNKWVGKMERWIEAWMDGIIKFIKIPF